MKFWEPNKEVLEKINETLNDEEARTDEVFFLGLIYAILSLAVEGMSHISEQLEEINNK